MQNAPQSSVDFSPVSLRYTVALRGIASPAAGTPFTYALSGAFDTEMLIALAGSNPEGTFFGILPDDAARNSAQANTLLHNTKNLSWLKSFDDLKQKLDFFCVVAGDEKLPQTSREALFSKAQDIVKEGGLFTIRYRAYTDTHEMLRFLANEYAPEFDANKEDELLVRLQKLGTRYFSANPERKKAIDTAAQSGKAQDYILSLCDEGEAESGAFNTMAGLLPRGFAYGGDADIRMNYLEVSAPQAAHESILTAQSPLLYESIKDFAMGRLFRNDIWIKLPVDQILDKPALFGPFVFGCVLNTNDLPNSLNTDGGLSIDLTSPLFRSIIELTSMLPMGIGDFLAHDLGKGQDPDDVLSTIQILIASGIIQPMRTRCETSASINLALPQPANTIASFLKEANISAPELQLASTITGRAIHVPARDALVLQAIGRVGLGHSAGALYQELGRISRVNPALVEKISGTQQPTHEVAETIVNSVVTSSMLKWYAYGLLAA